MKYVFPAVFNLESGTKETFNVSFPDLPGCNTFGESLAEAIEMAEDALAGTLWSRENDREPIPAPSAIKEIKVDGGDFVNLITADTDAYKKVMNKSVRTNVTLPEWLKKEAEAENINFSQTLQEALVQKLRVAE